jgi:hypothetical protein
MEDHKEPTRELQSIPRRGIRREKPRNRWLDDAEDNLRKAGVKCWRIKAIDRTVEKDMRRLRFFKSCRAM